MRALWRYIQAKDNRELLTLLCGGLAAVVTAGWVAYTHFSKKEAPDKPQTTISAPGDVAAGTITISPITVRPLPPPTSPSNTSPIVSETVDTVLKRLATGTVAFNVPDYMRLGRSQVLEARLGINVPREQLVREISSEGEIRFVQLKVSPRMQATLIGGTAFDVFPSGPQAQFVSNEESNIWSWQITPKLEGRQVLILTFDIFIEIGGKEGIRTVNTLRQPIVVEVAWPETPREWAEWLRKWAEYGGWLWTALLLPVVPFILRKWRGLYVKSFLKPKSSKVPNE